MRAAFDEATETFVAAVRAVPPEVWDAPGALGEWTVRELAAHTLRAFTAIETNLASEPREQPLVADATGFVGAVIANPAVHVAVAERGRQAGARLADPRGEVEAAAQRVRALVASTGDDDPIGTPAGTMVFSEYLVTRVFELGVHSLDLQRATNQVPRIGPAAAAVVLALLTEVADPARVILALTGRQPLPADYSVFG